MEHSGRCANCPRRVASDEDFCDVCVYDGLAALNPADIEVVALAGPLFAVLYEGRLAGVALIDDGEPLISATARTVTRGLRRRQGRVVERAA